MRTVPGLALSVTVLAAALALAGCAGSGGHRGVSAPVGGASGQMGGTAAVRFYGGAFHIGRNVDASSLDRSVLGVGIGTDASVVRSRFGVPGQVNRDGGLTCSWIRQRSRAPIRPESGFCVNAQHRVAKIMFSVHG